MRIQSLILKDFRRFENLRVDFDLDANDGGGLTLFVAPNGGGKTSILDAVNISLGTFVGTMPNATGGVLKISDQRTKLHDNQVSICGDVEISATFIDESFEAPVVIKRGFTASKKRVATTTKDAKPLAQYARKLLNETNQASTWPIVAYYGDSRLWAGERLTERRIAKTLAMGRDFGYSDAVNPKSGYKEFSIWFPALEFAVFAEEQRRVMNDPGFDEKKARRYRSQLEPIKEALRRALEPAGWREVVSDFAHGIWAIDTERKTRIPIDSLSAGVKIVVGLVGDIAFRCAKLNPHLERDALKETPGIVLIDEVELHLHPAWQQVILPTLRSIFPRIQFIATTHSPQVVSSVPQKCVRILIDDDVQEPFAQTQGVESQNALLEVFGVEPAPFNDPFVAKLRQYDQMVQENQGETESGKRLYQILSDHFGVNYPPLERIELFRRYATKRESGNNEE